MNMLLALRSTTHHQMKVSRMNFVLYELFVFFEVFFIRFLVLKNRKYNNNFKYFVKWK